MASTSSPYGLQPRNLLGGQGFAGSTRMYAIPSGYAVTIQYGDPVLIVNTGSTRGTLARFNSNNNAGQTLATGGGFGLVGVFVGCTYTDPTLGRVFRQNYPANLVASDIQAYVIDDPDALFTVQANGPLTQTALGCNAALIQTVAGSSVQNRISGVGLDATGGTIGTANTLPLRIVGFVDGPTSAIGDAFTDVIVRINTHFHRTGNTGSAGTAAT